MPPVYSKQCDHVWMVATLPCLVVCSGPRMFGYETSGPAVSCWHTLKPEELKDQVSPHEDSALDGVKQEVSSVVAGSNCGLQSWFVHSIVKDNMDR